jgi:hypothetical protein
MVRVGESFVVNSRLRGKYCKLNTEYLCRAILGVVIAAAETFWLASQNPGDSSGIASDDAAWL